MREQYEVQVWPENESAVDVYCAMQTQWRISQVGATGLDYACLPAVMDMVGVPKKEQTGIFESVRLMEATQLAEMRRAK